MTRPTPEQIKEARRQTSEFMAALRHNPAAVPTLEERAAIRTLLAATEPPTDEEIYSNASETWKSATAENEDDFTEGYFAAVRHFLGTPEGK